MATVVSYAPLNMSETQVWTGTALTTSAAVFASTDFNRTDFYDGAFVSGANGPTGTVTAYQEYDGGALSYSIDGLSLTMAAIYGLITSGQVHTALAQGLQGDDAFTGSKFADLIFAYAGNDLVRGGGGDDAIDGGAGVDTAVYSGPAAGYTIALTPGGGMTVTDATANRDGSDTLSHFEQLRFSDTILVYDLTSAADRNVYLIYQAALGRMPDNTGFRYWAGVADTAHLTPLQLADQFLASAEFVQLYGAAASDTQFVTALYAHVFGRAPDAAGLTYWTNNLQHGEARDQLLVDFALSAENQTLVGAHAGTPFWTIW